MSDEEKAAVEAADSTEERNDGQDETVTASEAAVDESGESEVTTQSAADETNEDVVSAESDEQLDGVPELRGKKMYTGLVVSDKMDKTIVVRVTTRKMHRLYKKFMVSSKKVKAHDEDNDAHAGDTVRVIESRPISKEKRWRLLEIVERAR